MKPNPLFILPVICLSIMASAAAQADIVWESPSTSANPERPCSEAKIQALLNSAKSTIETKKCAATERTYNHLTNCYQKAPRQMKLQLDEPLRDIEQFLFGCVAERWRSRVVR